MYIVQTSSNHQLSYKEFTHSESLQLQIFTYRHELWADQTPESPLWSSETRSSSIFAPIWQPGENKSQLHLHRKKLQCFPPYIIQEIPIPKGMCISTIFSFQSF